MTVQELEYNYINGLKIGLTTEELRESSDEFLRQYVSDYNFYIEIDEEDLEIILPPNDFVGEVPLGDCVTPIIIDDKIYVRMAIYKDGRRGMPTANDEFYLWLNFLGVNNIYKELPTSEEI